MLQVEYLYDVWVTKWSLVCVLNYDWNVEYKWQASHDKKQWVDIGGRMQTEKNAIKSLMNAENAAEWTFTNPIRAKGTKYKFWRVYGVGNKETTSGYISLLFMNIQ